MSAASTRKSASSRKTQHSEVTSVTSSARNKPSKPTVLTNKIEPLQAKLTINAPNDQYEREADSVAEHVMHMPERARTYSTTVSDSDNAVQVQRMEEEEEELQRSSMQSEDEEENLQMATLQRDEEEEDEAAAIQRKPSHQQSKQVSPAFESKLQALKSAGGQPMDCSLQRFMENRFGKSFSHVRVHTGAAAENLALQASARAFTVGKHLVFGRGEYRPGVDQGRRLVAHELTHVLQQQGGLHSVQREILNQDSEQVSEPESQSNTDVQQAISNLMDMDGEDVPVEVANFAAELIGSALRSPDGNLLRALAPAANAPTVRTIDTGEFSLTLNVAPQSSNVLAQWNLARTGDSGPFFSRSNTVAASVTAENRIGQAVSELDTATLFVATPSEPQFSSATRQPLSTPLVEAPSSTSTAAAANEPSNSSTATATSASGSSSSAPDTTDPNNVADASSTDTAPADAQAGADTAASEGAATADQGGDQVAVEILIPEPPSALSGAERGRIKQVGSNASSAQSATTDMPAAEQSVGEARGAVDEPTEETNARAQSALVDALGERPEPSPEIEELCLRIYEVIRSKRPVDEDALVKADPTDMASSAGQELNQGIQNDVDAVGSSYDELQQPQEGTPEQVGTEMNTPPSSVSTPDLNATSATPSGVNPEAVDVGPDVAANAQRITDAGMDTEVAQQIQDPANPVVAGREAQTGLEAVAERAPAEVLLEQEGILQEASASMAERQAQAAQALAKARAGAVDSTTGQQTQMVGSEEDMRVQASESAEKIFTEAQTQVRTLLTPLTDDAMKKWEAGVQLLSTKFEQKLKFVEDWIDERHSGALGSVVGVWDAVTGLPGWVTEEYDEAEKAFGDGVCDLIRTISVDVNLVVAAAEALIETARTNIDKVFSDLPAELQDWATTQQAGFTEKLDGLKDEASDTRNNFNKEITRSASQAVDEVRARVETLREEAGGLIGQIVSAVNDFIEDPVKFIIEGLLKLVGIPPASFWALINRIGQVLGDIADDPLNFANNMASAVGQGFQQFFTHFVDHVMGGFFEWLFSGLGSVGVNIPSDFSLKSIITLFLELMGITWPRIRALLARHIGEENVELIEKAYELVSTLIEQGPEGIFEMIKEQLDPQTILDMVIDAAIDFMITALISAVTPRVIAMFNPAGAIVQAVEVIFRILKWIFENAARIFSLIETVVNGAADLIAGNIAAMATAVEESLSKLIPPVIDFLAGFLGMGDLPDKIADTIRGFQEWIMSILEKVVAWLAERGKALLASLGIGGEKEEENENETEDEDENVLTETVSMEGETHTLRIKIETGEVTIASTEAPLIISLNEGEENTEEYEGKRTAEEAQAAIAKMKALLKLVEEELKKYEPGVVHSVDRSKLREFNRQTKIAMEGYGSEFNVSEISVGLEDYGPVEVGLYGKLKSKPQPDGSSRERHHVPPKELAQAIGRSLEGTADELKEMKTKPATEARKAIIKQYRAINTDTDGDKLLAVSIHRVTHQNAGGVAVHAAAMKDEIIAAVRAVDKKTNTETQLILNQVGNELSVNPRGATLDQFIQKVHDRLEEEADEREKQRQLNLLNEAKSDADAIEADATDDAVTVAVNKAKTTAKGAFDSSYAQAVQAVNLALANSILDGPQDEIDTAMSGIHGKSESSWSHVIT